MFDIRPLDEAYPLIVRIKLYFGDAKFPHLDFHARGRDHQDLLNDVINALQRDVDALHRHGDTITLVHSTSALVCCESRGNELCNARVKGSFDQVIKQASSLLDRLIKDIFSMKEPDQTPMDQPLSNVHQSAWDRAIGHLTILGYRPFRRRRRGNGGSHHI